MTARKSKDKAPSFEAQLSRLEELTSRLEAGDLPLEEALGAYEEGVAITRRLLSQLDAAEKRIRVLTEGSVGLREEPADIETGGAAGPDGESDVQ
jgi:exodeoxyribonuclease VII small subunit